ncbi:hypothetical protein T310_8642, partial [Rasamsonia emersonii CBS 393.64]
PLSISNPLFCTGGLRIGVYSVLLDVWSFPWMNSGSIAVAHPTSTDQSASRFISRRAPPSPARVSLRRAGRSTEQLSPAEQCVCVDQLATAIIILRTCLTLIWWITCTP